MFSVHIFVFIKLFVISSLNLIKSVLKQQSKKKKRMKILHGSSETW